MAAPGAALQSSKVDKELITMTSETLVGKWAVRVGPQFQTDWTFGADGTVTSTRGESNGTWRIEVKNGTATLLIEWPIARAWERLPLPLDPEKATGISSAGPGWKIEAVKFKDQPKPPAKHEIDDLQSPNQQTRIDKLARLLEVKSLHSGWAPLLVTRMREDSSPVVRRAAAHALGKIQPIQKLVLAALTETILDTEEVPGVRRAAVNELAKHGRGSAKIIQILETAAGDQFLTDEAIRWLLFLRQEAKAAVFLEHKNDRVRGLTIQWLVFWGYEPALIQTLAKSDSMAWLRVTEGLKNRDFQAYPLRKGELDALAKAAANPDPQLRAFITSALKGARVSAIAIPTLVEGLSSPHPDVVLTSAEALGVAGSGVAKHLPEILAALEKAHRERVRLALILALGEAEEEAKPALPALFALLHDGSEHIRRRALRALFKAGAADPVETKIQIRPFLADPDPETRNTAFLVQAELTENRALIVSNLRNPDLNVGLGTLTAIRHLGYRGGTLAPELLAFAARIPDPWKGFGDPTRSIGETLALLGPKVVAPVIAGFDSPSTSVQKACREALQDISWDAVGAVPELRKGLASRNPETRKWCALALRGLGCGAQEAVPDLIKLLATQEDSARWAGEALARMGQVSAEDAKQLIEIAKKPATDEARLGRIKALLAVGKDALPALDEIERGLGAENRLSKFAVQDVRREMDREKEIDRLLGIVAKEPRSRTEATAALALGASPEKRKILVEHLTKRLDSGTIDTQLEVMRILGWMGADAAAALPSIERFLTSPNETLRRFAKDTARRVRPLSGAPDR